MNDQTRIDLARRAAQAFTDYADAVAKGFQDRIRDAQIGQLRSPSFEAGTGPEPSQADLPENLRGRVGYSDPTGTAGVQVAQWGDRAAADLRRVDKILAHAAREGAELDDVRRTYTPRDPSLFDLQEAKDPEPGCVSCARVASPGTVGRAKRDQTAWWNEPTRTTTLSDGRKVGLCNFCYEAREIGARWTGDLPPVTEVEYLRDNGRPRKRSA